MIWAAALVFLTSGCAWKGGGGAPQRGLRTGASWHPTPVSMRVYPSTRFVQEKKGSALEARVELTDEMGDPVKAVGAFRLELFAIERAGEPGIGRRLYSWDASTLTLDEQHSYYDSITRAYLFRLKLEEATTPDHDTLLQVMFTAADGRRLEAQATLPIDFKKLGAYRAGK